MAAVAKVCTAVSESPTIISVLILMSSLVLDSVAAGLDGRDCVHEISKSCMP